MGCGKAVEFNSLGLDSEKDQSTYTNQPQHLNIVLVSLADKTALTCQDMHRGPLRMSYGVWHQDIRSGSFGLCGVQLLK